jgi:predicted HNH restriction endonuclease
MIDWFSQRWTVRDEKWKPLFQLFQRRKDGPRWSYEPIGRVQEGDVILEGALIQRSVNVYDRSSLARLRCIGEYGTNCCICGFSFGVKYGKTFQGVHSRSPFTPVGEIRPKSSR